ncbi:MAG: type IV pilus assembly protein PilM [Armatimonadetes bacterium]|nr:type IV pilus assembly protein PilM [Armatimonadota bacterium]MBS1703970.1 type IV pilus assembly protein PilM [Armatimonadota bacterium]MBS1727980.1 type IV pilus assembly protein PilM [Armatimonadota bacterium]
MAGKKSSVGVDIGYSSIRIVQVEKTAAGVRVTKFATVPTPPDSVRDGLVRDPEEVGQAIKTAMKDAHIHASTAVVAASGGAVFVRTVPFPKMTPQMLRESIKFEAGRYVPGSIEDSYVEGEILGNLNETQMNVLLAAAPKDVVDGRIAACKVAGLDVRLVEIETFAAYRALLETDEAKDTANKTYILVDIGATSTTVSVIENGVYVMLRSMPNAGNTLTEALKAAFKLEAVDAEAGKSALDMNEFLTPQGLENPPLKVIAAHVDDLVRELRRSMNYLQTQNSEATQATNIDGMFLCGGGAKLKGLDQYLQAKLGIPVTTLGVFENPIITQTGAISGTGVDLAVATGLAMRPVLWAA